MKGLVVSWFFPPATSAEGLVTFKLLKNSGFEYDVISSESRQWSYGADSILKSASITPHPVQCNGFKEFINNGEAVAVELIKARKYEFLMTRSMPPQSHTIGLKIKRKNPDQFWIVSLADPIGHNPYDYDRYFRRGFLTLIKQLPLTIARVFIYLRNEFFERKIIKKADMLIFPSEDQCKYTLRKDYDKYKKKILIVPHSFDTSINPNTEEILKTNDKIVISHLGHLNIQRSPLGLIKAVEKLNKEYPELALKLIINLVGNLPEQFKDYIKKAALEGIFKLHEPVDYFESLKIMQNSDMLLLIDADFSFLPHNIFFASKLADYMGFKKPVLGLTTKEGPSGSILTRAGCPVCRPNDVDDIFNAIKNIAEHGIDKFKPEVYSDYESKKVASIFDRTIIGTFK